MILDGENDNNNAADQTTKKEWTILALLLLDTLCIYQSEVMRY